MRFPLDKIVSVTGNSESFKRIDFSTHTQIPVGNHVGAFGYVRKHNTHEGVDLYCINGDSVYAMEAGIVVGIQNFTGESAIPPMPWWNDTKALLIEGESGVLVYGEIDAKCDICVGDKLAEGALIGNVVTVLKKDKGRPMSMLHMELHRRGTVYADFWEGTRPASLLDVTSILLKSIGHVVLQHYI